MPRPTRKAFSLTAAALLLLVLGGSSQSGWLYVLAAGILGVVAAGFVMPARLVSKITAARKVPPVAIAGEEAPSEITLTNPSKATKGPLVLSDSMFDDHSFLVESLGPRSSVTLRTAVTPPKRGVFGRHDLKLQTGAPFGIARVSRKIEVESPITVHPRWAALNTFPLLELTSTPQESLHERRRDDGGTDFFGLREYRPGDSLRAVHWKSTARFGSLLVKEYEEQIGSRLGILIEGTTTGIGADTSFETSVSCAASLVMYALDAGHPVQLFCDTAGGVDHLFEPSKAETLDWLARLEEKREGDLPALVEFAVPHIYRRSTNVIVFSTTHRTAREIGGAVIALQNLGSRVIAMAVSARSYQGGPGALNKQQEDGLIERLTAMRAIVYRAECGKELAECLREPLTL
ncbi:MAG: DUF58 domain-containing protein [Actinomycetota bacterium]